MPACQSPAGLSKRGRRGGGVTANWTILRIVHSNKRRDAKASRPVTLQYFFFTLRPQTDLLKKKWEGEGEKKALSVWVSFNGESRVTAGCQSWLFRTVWEHKSALMYIANPHHIAQPEPVFLRLAFLTFYPPLKINQPGWKAALHCFFYTSSRSRDYFYNGVATAADTRHNKGNRHLAEFPQEESVDQYIIIICLYIGGKASRRYVDTDICRGKYVEIEFKMCAGGEERLKNSIGEKSSVREGYKSSRWGNKGPSANLVQSRSFTLEFGALKDWIERHVDFEQRLCCPRHRVFSLGW